MNNLGFNLGLRRLKAKKFVEAVELHDEQNGSPYSGIQLTERGWQWIELNEAKFTFHTAWAKKAPVALFDDDVPF